MKYARVSESNPKLVEYFNPEGKSGTRPFATVLWNDPETAKEVEGKFNALIAEQAGEEPPEGTQKAIFPLGLFPDPDHPGAIAARPIAQRPGRMIRPGQTQQERVFETLEAPPVRAAVLVELDEGIPSITTVGEVDVALIDWTSFSAETLEMHLGEYDKLLAAWPVVLRLTLEEQHHFVRSVLLEYEATWALIEKDNEDTEQDLLEDFLQSGGEFVKLIGDWLLANPGEGATFMGAATVTARYVELSALVVKATETYNARTARNAAKLP